MKQVFWLTPAVVAAAATASYAQEKKPDPLPIKPPAFPAPEIRVPTGGSPSPQTPDATSGKASPDALPQPLSLADAIGFALRLQPQIAGATASREGAEQREKQQVARFYPTITPQYTYNNNYTFGTVNQFVSGTNGGTVVAAQQGRTSENRAATLGLSFRLYDSGSRDLGARQARQSLRATSFSEQSIRQNVIGNVATNYFNALRTDALVRVSAAQVERARNTFDLVTAQVEAGVTAKKDTYQAEADYLNAQVALLQAQNNAEVAQAQLKNSIGLVGGERIALADVPPPAADTPITADPSIKPSLTGAAGDINALADLAYKTRPDIAQTVQNIEASRTGVKIADINSRVVVTSDVSAGDQFSPTGFDRSIGNNRQLNVNVSYPLFDAGAARANANAQRASVRVSEANLDQQRQQVAVEVEQAYRNLAQARQSLPAAQLAVRAAEINVEAAKASLKEGVSSIVDVITAQTSLVQAQTNYVQAIYTFYSADAALARAVGQADRISASSAAVNAPAQRQIQTQPTPAPTTPDAPKKP